MSLLHWLFMKEAEVTVVVSTATAVAMAIRQWQQRSGGKQGGVDMALKL